jgi:cell division protein ZapA (FtsZ GTPase activity inhibitor)
MADSNDHIAGSLVEIFGQEFTIGGEPAEVRQVAAYVDRKMCQIAADHNGRLPANKVAVLAAMDITAELLRLVQERSVLTQKAHENINRLTKLVEERVQITETPEREQSRLDRLLRVQPILEHESSPLQ